MSATVRAGDAGVEARSTTLERELGLTNAAGGAIFLGEIGRHGAHRDHL